MTLARQSRRKAAGELELAQLTTQAAEERRVLKREWEKGAAVRREHRALRGEIEFARELYFFLRGNVGAYDTLWQYLGAIRDLRAGGLPPTDVYLRKLTAQTRHRVIEILQRTVSDDLVPHGELARWRETAKGEAEAALREEKEAVLSPTGEEV